MHLRTRTATVALLFLAALSSGTLLPSAAGADELLELERAKELFREADRHFKLGEYREAIPLYREAHKVMNLPAFLFNLGQCHYHLGECDQASAQVEQHLAAQPGSPHADAINEMMASCAAATTTLPEPDPASGWSSPGPGPEEEKGFFPPVGTGTRRTLIWAGTGVTVVMLLTGTITAGIAWDKSETFNDPTTPYDDLEDLESSGMAAGNMAIASFVLAGAAALGTLGVYLFYPNEPEAPTVAVTALPDGGGVSLTGRF